MIGDTYHNITCRKNAIHSIKYHISLLAQNHRPNQAYPFFDSERSIYCKSKKKKRRNGKVFYLYVDNVVIDKCQKRFIGAFNQNQNDERKKNNQP